MPTQRFLLAVVSSLALSLPAQAQSGPIEPNAGSWKPWVISSGKDSRMPSPACYTKRRSAHKVVHAPARPLGAPEPRHEPNALAGLVAHNEWSIQQQSGLWHAGRPSVPWMALLSRR